MDVLERYLQAIGQYLPLESRSDTLAELRENLLAEMEDREESVGRPLTEQEIGAVLRAHGKPEFVAARYLPQQYLIGPGIFPSYLLILRKFFPLLILVCVVGHAWTILSAHGAGALAGRIALALVEFIPAVLTFWGSVTLIFAVIEYAQRSKKTGESESWDPTKLPPVEDPAQPKPRSTTGRVADLIVHSLWMVYVLLIPHHLFLILGPGNYVFDRHMLVLAPVWHVFYVILLCLLSVQLVTKIATFFRGAQRVILPLNWLVRLIGLALAAVLASASLYLLPGTAGMNAAALAAMNHGINLAFRIVLLIQVLNLLWDVWKYRSRWLPSSRFAL